MQTQVLGASFDLLVEKLGPSIRRQIEPFTRDWMLSRIEDSDSLFNLALIKLEEARKNFVYDDKLSQEHNEHRFLAMLKVYIRNEMIDRQYAANVDKRKPKDALIFSCSCHLAPEIVKEQDDWSSVLIDKSGDVIDNVIGAEFDSWMREKLSDEEERIYNLLCQGMSAENIAGRMGIATSRVRYIIYGKLQSRASRYA